jgi:hypothetical protein
MMRTTVDIDPPVLGELKRLQKKERKSLGRLVSDLLADALGRRRHRTSSERPVFQWTQRSMAARVELTDKDALYRVLDRPARGRRRRRASRS